MDRIQSGRAAVMGKKTLADYPGSFDENQGVN